MSDIVERLRKSTDCDPQCHGRCEECPQNRQREAADEIERLRSTPTQDAREALIKLLEDRCKGWEARKASEFYDPRLAGVMLAEYQMLIEKALSLLPPSKVR